MILPFSAFPFFRLRVLVRLGVGTRDEVKGPQDTLSFDGDEASLLERRLERRVDDVVLEPVVDAEGLREMQRAVEDVHVSEPARLYMVDLVAATRESPRVLVGSSPRGSLALMKLSRCRAALEGRDFVTLDDVKAVAVPALAHRLTLRPELWAQEVRGEDVVRETLEAVIQARNAAYAGLKSAAVTADTGLVSIPPGVTIGPRPFLPRADRI